MTGPACRGMPVEMFDDEGPELAKAKAVCEGCAIRKACRDSALSEPWGVWGGLTVVERRAFQGGAEERRCLGCGLLTARRAQSWCMACRPTLAGPSPLSEFVQEVLHLAGVGWSDKQIAAKFTVELDRKIGVTSVRHMRRRNGVAAGRTVRAREVPIDEVAVERSLDRPNHEAFRRLTLDERCHLILLWLRRGGTVTSFHIKYGISHQTAADIRRRAMLRSRHLEGDT